MQRKIAVVARLLRANPRHLDLRPARARTHGSLQRRGKPGLIVSDNGAELDLEAMFAWAHDNRVVSFHCARKADAEWLLREFQRAHASSAFRNGRCWARWSGRLCSWSKLTDQRNTLYLPLSYPSRFSRATISEVPRSCPDLASSKARSITVALWVTLKIPHNLAAMRAF